MNRRDFLIGAGGAGLAVGAAAVGGARGQVAGSTGKQRLDGGDWESVRAQFDLDPAKIHLTGFFLASHPRPVREAIQRHRAGLEADPVGYWEEHRGRLEREVSAAASEYLSVKPAEIALTDSTTMGLGLLYAGISVREGQEILSTTHDHYSTRCSLEFRAQRTGAVVRTIALYEDSARATADEVVGNLAKALTAKTRVVAMTWVHSSTGVRLPIAEMSQAIADANKGRDENDRILFCVDGVHGLGIVDTTLPALGCDFFVAGTHKWVLGPRGTGILWGRADAWPHVQPTIPPFGRHDEPGGLHSPGGFHSYEHRWALNEAFSFHLAVGKARVQARILELNQRIRDGLAGMPHISLATPMSADLSAGINCFDVRGMNPGQVVHRLAQRNIVASESPYARSYVRLAGSLLVNESQVDEALGAVRRLA